MPEARKIRVLAAKPGLDGHDRGIKVICAALRDAGMEVIYTGLRQTPEQIVAAVVQEDADVIAMSVLSGAHNYLFPRVMDLVKEKGIADVLVMGGGIIPDEDIPLLAGCRHRRHLRPRHRYPRHHQFYPGECPQELIKNNAGCAPRPSINFRQPVAQASGLWSSVFRRGGPMGPSFFLGFQTASQTSAHPRVKGWFLI